MSDMESSLDKKSTLESKPSESVSDLSLLDSVVVNDGLTLNFYKNGDQILIGLEHFNFDDEIMLKHDSMKKVVELFNLHEKEQNLTKTLKDSGFKR